MELNECYNMLIGHKTKDVYMLCVALLNENFDDEKIIKIIGSLDKLEKEVKELEE